MESTTTTQLWATLRGLAQGARVVQRSIAINSGVESANCLYGQNSHNLLPTMGVMQVWVSSRRLCFTAVWPLWAFTRPPAAAGLLCPHRLTQRSLLAACSPARLLEHLV